MVVGSPQASGRSGGRDCRDRAGGRPADEYKLRASEWEAGGGLPRGHRVLPPWAAASVELAGGKASRRRRNRRVPSYGTLGLGHRPPSEPVLGRALGAPSRVTAHFTAELPRAISGVSAH